MFRVRVKVEENCFYEGIWILFRFVFAGASDHRILRRERRSNSASNFGTGLPWTPVSMRIVLGSVSSFQKQH